MKKNIIRGFIMFAVLLTVIMAAMYITVTNQNSRSKDAGYELVNLNEIVKLHESGKNKEFEESVDDLRQQLEAHKGENENSKYIKLIMGIYFAFLAGDVILFIYIYVKLIRPFEKMKEFAMQIAQGNMEATLQIDRDNYFGDFTWSFDHMRGEIIKARKSEKEAIENNKTVIATLSHDIKTPIASIRAYCEALEANMDQNPERRRRYTNVITKKCDEVTRLTNDLFIHSISDMNKLTITEEQVDISELLSEVIAESGLGSNIIRLNKMAQGVLVTGDKKRIAQVFENIFTNAGKYATGSPIDVESELKDDILICTIRDHGHGIPAEDMPFIKDKFYRGKNAGDQPGSGLGLYIVNYIMQHMNGSADINSYDDGLEVILKFRTIS